VAALEQLKRLALRKGDLQSLRGEKRLMVRQLKREFVVAAEEERLHVVREAKAALLLKHPFLIG
jgi:predicted lipid carrier protein YhbT